MFVKSKPTIPLQACLCLNSPGRELWFRAQSVNQTSRSIKLGLIAVGGTSSVKRRRKPTGLRQARSRGYDQRLIAEGFKFESPSEITSNY